MDVDTSMVGVVAKDYINDYQYDLERKVDNVDNEADNTVGDTKRFIYPRLPNNMDFETFRKQYKIWKEIVAFYNKPLLENKSDDEKKRIYRERFVNGSWPRCPNYKHIGNLPKGKQTNNGDPGFPLRLSNITHVF